jgi:transposase
LEEYAARFDDLLRELIAEREWLTVFLLPAYSPDLNPVEGVWAHVKRSLANLAVVALDRLEALVRNRLKRLHPRNRQSATGPPDSYPDRTHTGKRRRADNRRSTT